MLVIWWLFTQNIYVMPIPAHNKRVLNAAEQLTNVRQVPNVSYTCLSNQKSTISRPPIPAIHLYTYQHPSATFLPNLTPISDFQTKTNPTKNILQEVTFSIKISNTACSITKCGANTTYVPDPPLNIYMWGFPQWYYLHLLSRHDQLSVQIHTVYISITHPCLRMLQHILTSVGSSISTLAQAIYREVYSIYKSIYSKASDIYVPCQLYQQILSN